SRASTQKTRRCLPFSRAEVRKIRSFQMIGDDWPIPLSGALQTTDEASQRTGTLVAASICPSPRGPRQRGQFDSARAGTAVTTVSRTTENRGSLTRNRRSIIRFTSRIRTDSHDPATRHLTACRRECGASKFRPQPARVQPSIGGAPVYPARGFAAQPRVARLLSGNPGVLPKGWLNPERVPRTQG